MLVCMWKQSEVNCCSMYVYEYHSYVRTYVYNAVRSIMYIHTYVRTCIYVVLLIKLLTLQIHQIMMMMVIMGITLGL